MPASNGGPLYNVLTSARFCSSFCSIICRTFGIIAFLALTGFGLPVPEEAPIVAAGIMSSNGQLDPWWAFWS